MRTLSTLTHLQAQARPGTKVSRQIQLSNSDRCASSADAHLCWLLFLSVSKQSPVTTSSDATSYLYLSSPHHVSGRTFTLLNHRSANRFGIFDLSNKDQTWPRPNPRTPTDFDSDQTKATQVLVSTGGGAAVLRFSAYQSQVSGIQRLTRESVSSRFITMTVISASAPRDAICNSPVPLSRSF